MTKYEIDRLVTALEQIRNRCSYHMTLHAKQTGDRKVLGEIKELAIQVLRECQK